MQKNMSLVFDLELEDGCPPGTYINDPSIGSLLREADRLLRPTIETEYMLMCEVEALGFVSSRDTTALTQRLVELGYLTKLRTGLGGSISGGECLQNLRHTFVSCSQAGSGLEPPCFQQFIIDPHFREQFLIARPTVRYASLLSVVPEVYVGLESRIAPAVELLCREMAEAFKQTSTVVPPWRTAAAMISKWHPRRSMDITHGLPGVLTENKQSGFLIQPTPLSPISPIRAQHQPAPNIFSAHVSSPVAMCQYQASVGRDRALDEEQLGESDGPRASRGLLAQFERNSSYEFAIHC